MASIRKRPERPKPYEARDWAPDGQQRSRSFKRKGDAEKWLATQTADVARGAWVDPSAGKVSLEEFGRAWLEVQTFDPATYITTEIRLRVHLFPHLGHYELRALRPSSIQAWVRGLQRTLSLRYVRAILAALAQILNAAVEDGLIARNPRSSAAVRAPTVPAGRVVPWTQEMLDAVITAHPTAYRAVPIVVAGEGLRQGEVFGLAVDAVDFLGGTVHVRLQVKLLRGKVVFALPKGKKARQIPLAEPVAFALSERLRRYPAREVTLPFGDVDGPLQTHRLIFKSREAGPVNRNYYNPFIWKPSLRAAGVPDTRANGMHALRHYFASVLLEGGVSIRAVATYLGHADPGFTLRTYTHLMPTSEDRVREVIVAAFDARPSRDGRLTT